VDTGGIDFGSDFWVIVDNEGDLGGFAGGEDFFCQGEEECVGECFCSELDDSCAGGDEAFGFGKSGIAGDIAHVEDAVEFAGRRDFHRFLERAWEEWGEGAGYSVGEGRGGGEGRSSKRESYLPPAKMRQHCRQAARRRRGLTRAMMREQEGQR